MYKSECFSDISIHALREEGDMLTLFAVADVAVFLSTPSARKATYGYNKLYNKAVFLSTPSARKATIGVLMRIRPFSYFYPRPPRGRRRG